MLAEFCHRGHLGVRVELGGSLIPDLSHTQPVDVLVLNWEGGKHAAFDITVTSPLIPSILTAASLSEEAAAEEAETRNHKINDPKCLELDWVYTAYPDYLYMYISGADAGILEEGRGGAFCYKVGGGLQKGVGAGGGYAHSSAKRGSF